MKMGAQPNKKAPMINDSNVANINNSPLLFSYLSYHTLLNRICANFHYMIFVVQKEMKRGFSFLFLPKYYHKLKNSICFMKL